MAFISDVNPKETYEVILFGDSAVNCSEEEYTEYLDSFKGSEPNEDILRMDADAKPTRYVLRKTLSFDAKQKLRSKNLKVSEDGTFDTDFNYMADVVRVSLIDIKDHPETPKTLANTFKRDKDGFASAELINHLDDLGQSGFLFLAHIKIQQNMKESVKKK